MQYNHGVSFVPPAAGVHCTATVHISTLEVSVKKLPIVLFITSSARHGSRRMDRINLFLATGCQLQDVATRFDSNVVTRQGMFFSS